MQKLWSHTSISWIPKSLVDCCCMWPNTEMRYVTVMNTQIFIYSRWQPFLTGLAAQYINNKKYYTNDVLHDRNAIGWTFTVYLCKTVCYEKINYSMIWSSKNLIGLSFLSVFDFPSKESVHFDMVQRTFSVLSFCYFHSSVTAGAV